MATTNATSTSCINTTTTTSIPKSSYIDTDTITTTSPWISFNQISNWKEV